MVHARLARPDDAPAMGRVHVRAWQAAYRGLMPPDHLGALSADERTAMWQGALSRPRERSRLIVAERDGAVVGFAAIGPAGGDEDDAARDGQLYAINVDPDHWGAGAGRALMDAVHGGLSAFGFAEAVLWVHPENDRARRFYERAGWTFDQATRDEELLGIVVPEVRYRRHL